MKLKCLGSSSKGNCYLLENDTEALVIEAGVPFKEVKQALDFNVSKIKGLIVSHSHGDHAKYIKDYEVVGIEVFAPFLESIGKAVNETYRFGNFRITAFPVVHDIHCYGFFISHIDMGTMVFATDTSYVQFKFNKPNHLLIEANYSEELLTRNNPNYRHVMEGHMSIDTACGFIEANKSEELKNVVLIHLSDGNSNEKEFVEQVKELVGSDVYVNAADKGLEIDLLIK